MCSRCFLYWISTLSRDSWAPVALLSPLWAQRGEVLASTPRSFTYGGHHKVLGSSFGASASLWENCGAWQNYFLSSFPSVFHRHHSIHPVFTQHPNITVGVWMGPVLSFHCTPHSQFPFLCLCLSVANQPSGLNEEWSFCMWVNLSECVSAFSLVPLLTSYYRYRIAAVCRSY